MYKLHKTVHKTVSSVTFRLHVFKNSILSLMLVLIIFWPLTIALILLLCLYSLIHRVDLFLKLHWGFMIIHIIFRSSRPEVFLRKVVLKICSKVTGEHPCRSAILIKLQSKSKKDPKRVSKNSWMLSAGAEGRALGICDSQHICFLIICKWKSVPSFTLFEKVTNTKEIDEYQSSY